jgi:hypothetical protein
MLRAMMQDFNRVMGIYCRMGLFSDSFELVSQRKTMAGGAGKTSIVVVSSDTPTAEKK